MNDLVSVVIPTYNREKVIIRAVNSVISQTYQNFEIIIVDDGSTDNTIDIINKINDKRIKIIKNDHKGANHARNTGIINSKGKYIAFLDSDDEWMPEKLEYQLAFMKDNDFAISFTPYMMERSQKIVPEDYRDSITKKDYVLDNLRKHNIIGTPTIILRRDIAITDGMFNESLKRLQDYDLVIRLIKKHRIGCCPKVLLFAHDDDKGRLSNDDDELKKSLIYIANQNPDFIDIEESEVYKLILQKDYEFGEALADSFNDSHCFKNIIHIVFSLYKEKQNEYKKIQSQLSQLLIHNLYNNNFYIYGAGKYGKELLKILRKNDLFPISFLVTRKDGNIQNVDGIEVKEINELNDKNSIIIVAVDTSLQLEILSILHQNEFYNVVIDPFIL